jgi:hypothetical protein
MKTKIAIFSILFIQTIFGRTTFSNDSNSPEDLTNWMEEMHKKAEEIKNDEDLLDWVKELRSRYEEIENNEEAKAKFREISRQVLEDKKKRDREEGDRLRKEYEKQWKEIKSKWRILLVEAIREADKIEIRPTSPEGQGKVLHTISGNHKIQEFINAVDIIEEESGFHCMCDGDALLVFMKESRELATLSYHHNRSLRWHGGSWVGDAMLAKKSKAELPKWFESQGYSGFADIDRRELEEQKERQEFMKYFPEEVQEDELGSSIENPIKDRLKELAKKYDEEVAKIYSSSLAMGLATYVDSQTEFVRFYLGHFKGESFENTLNELENNKQGILGAAYTYFRYISLLDMDHKDNLVKGDCKLTGGEKEKFGLRLAPYILNSDTDWQKRWVVKWLSETNNPKANSMLFDIARGELGKEISSDDPRLMYEMEPGIRATAYLYLVQRKELTTAEEIKRVIEDFEQEQDIAALKLALCLLGESNTFDESYFTYFSFTIGNAALEVIEKNPTRENIDILVNTGIEDSYGIVREEAKYLFQKITKVDWLPAKGENQEKKKRMSYTEELEKIRQWWKDNRDKFAD